MWRALVLVRSFLAPALCSFLDLLLLAALRCCCLLPFCSTPLLLVSPGVVVGEELSIEPVLTLPVISACFRLVLPLVPVLFGMGWEDDNVLPGPRYPLWGCSKCGHSANWASRIKCKCGVTAPTRIVQAAKREAAAIRVQPSNAGAQRARGKWAQGPPKRDDELSKLRSENAKLREAAKNGGVEGDGVEAMEDEPTDVDIDKVQVVYAATVAAYGENSTRAKDLAAKLDGLRAARREAKPLSLQLRAAEGS